MCEIILPAMPGKLRAVIFQRPEVNIADHDQTHQNAGHDSAEKQFADLWNGVDISTEGGSMGGFQAVSVAALYDKVNSVNSSVPWMCDIGGERVSTRFDGWRPEYDEVSKYFDTTYFAERLKCRTSVYGGLGDYTCPPSGVVSLYNALDCEKDIRFSQLNGHGGDLGKYSGSYSVNSHNPVIDPMEQAIVDNGCAVPDRDFNPNRTLNDAELKIKEITDTAYKKEKMIPLFFENSSYMDENEFSALIYEKLTETYGLDKSCTVVSDHDSFGEMRRNFSETATGGQRIETLDYTVTDPSGNYVDAKIRFLLTKGTEVK